MPLAQIGSLGMGATDLLLGFGLGVDAPADAIGIDVFEIRSGRGQRGGHFRKGLDAIDLHLTISALAFFNVSNQATFSAIFNVDMGSMKALAIRRAQVVDVVMRYVAA